MLIPDQGAGSSGMYVTVAPDQQPCLYKLYTTSIHVCYSLILSASIYIMSVTFAYDHLPCLSQMHLINSHVC